MFKELYWKRAIKITKETKEKGSLTPLITKDITENFYNKKDFIIRELDITQFDRKKIIGPSINPFKPWDKDLEIGIIGKTHQLILNKYPVESGHLLLITREWMPQDGWLNINDWSAIKHVNKDTSGLWFFNSGPLAGASQPHRHIQLLRRKHNQLKCPREEWFIRQRNYENQKDLLTANIICKDFSFNNSENNLLNIYLELAERIGLGCPSIDKKPKYPYNLIITNNWIAIIKRSKDHILGFSINALGFAGYILTTNKTNIKYLSDYGPEKLLENFIDN